MAKKKRKAPPQYKTGPKKGQFKPRASKAKRSPQTKRKATATKRKTTMAKKKRKSTKRRNPSGGKKFQKEAMDLMMGGAAYGFLTKQTDPDGAIRANLAKLPNVGNKDITNGLALYFANKYIVKNKYVNSMALAALVVGATKLGESGFDLDEQEKAEVAGGGNDFDLAGGGDDFDLAGMDDAIDVTEEGGLVSGIID